MDGFHQTALAFMLPAPGQGAVAVQCRADDHETLAVLQTIHDLPSAVAVTAERAVLAGLGGGCHTPVGVLATISNDTIHLKAAWYYDPALDPATASVTKPLTEWTRAASDVIDQLYGQTK
jgi:porphobilinogen deaminase